MKTIYSILITPHFHGTSLYSQTGNYEVKLKKEKAKIEQEAKELSAKLEKDITSTAFLKQITIDFTVDTFKIERLIMAKQKIDPSNASIYNSYLSAESEYKKLVDNYYQLLLSKLNDTDKAILQQSQNSWMQHYNSELNLNNTVSKDEYTGGGNMQGIFAAYSVYDFTKFRAIRLYRYISRMFNI
jgi:uncharacterized protein YecT (DUF1311 family)